MTKGVILFGHGSRDPQWRGPMDAVAQRIAALSPEVQVRCAFLEILRPDLLAAADELVAAGVTKLTVLPLFVGTGRHARHDFPLLIERLRERHPAIAVRLRASAGDDPQVVDLLARLALE